MRCRVGDLAVIVGAEDWHEEEDLGKFVRIVELGDDWSDCGDSRAYWRCESMSGPLWIEMFDAGRSDGWEKGKELQLADAALRPIRPDEGQDETLRWLDVPHKEVA